MEFRVGLWLASADRNRLIRKGQTRHITPKSMDLLVYLAKRCPAVVPKADIFREVWAGTFVSDDALTRCIGELRRAFGEAGQQPGILETVPKRGYRIVAPVVWINGADAPSGTVPGGPVAEEAGSESADGAPIAAGLTCRTRFRKLFSTVLMVLLVGIAAAALYNPVRNSLVWRKSPQVRSIAVLPLVNHSGDADSGVFRRRNDGTPYFESLQTG